MPESLGTLASRLEAGARVSRLWREYANTTRLVTSKLAIFSLGSLIADLEAQLDRVHDTKHSNRSTFENYDANVERLKILIDIYDHARDLFYAEALRRAQKAPGQTLENFIKDLEGLGRKQPDLDGQGQVILGAFLGLSEDVQCRILGTSQTFMDRSLQDFIKLAELVSKVYDVKLESLVFVVPKKRQRRMSVVGSEEHEPARRRIEGSEASEAQVNTKEEKAEPARRIAPLPQRFYHRNEAVVEAYKTAARKLSGSQSTDWDTKWAVYRKRKARLEGGLREASTLASTPAVLQPTIFGTQRLNQDNNGEAYATKPEAAYQVPIADRSTQKENHNPVHFGIPYKSTADVEKKKAGDFPANDWVDDFERDRMIQRMRMGYSLRQ